MVSKKVILIIIVVVVILLLAGLGVGLYFLLRPEKVPTTGNTGGTTNSRPPNPTGATNSTPVNPTNSTPTPTPPAPAPTPTPQPIPNPTSIISLLYTQPILANLSLTTQDNLPDYFTYSSVSKFTTYPVPANSVMIKSTTVFNDGNLVAPLAAQLPFNGYTVNYYYKRVGDYLDIEFPRNWRNEGTIQNNLINYSRSTSSFSQTFTYCLTNNLIQAGHFGAGTLFTLTTLGSGDIYYYKSAYINDTLPIPSSDIAQITFAAAGGGYVTSACEYNRVPNSSLFFYRLNMTSQRVEILIPNDWLGVKVTNGLIGFNSAGNGTISDLYLYTFSNNLNYKKVSLVTSVVATVEQVSSYQVYNRYNVVTYTGFNGSNLYDLVFNYSQDGKSYKLFSNNISVHGTKFAVFYYYFNTGNNVLRIYFPVCNRYGNGTNQNLLINNTSLNGNLEAWYFS